MSDTSFTVDAGATRFKRGAADGVAETQAFRITAPGATAVEIAAMQLLAASGTRRREVMRDPWAKAERAGWPASAACWVTPRSRIASCTGGRPVYQ